MTVNSILRAKNELDKKVSWALQDFENSVGIRVKGLEISALCDPTGELITYFVQSRIDMDGVSVERYSNSGGNGDQDLEEFRKKLGLEK